MTIEAALAKHLTTRGVLTFSTSSAAGVDTFLDRVPQTPDLAVGIFLNGGNPIAEWGGTHGYDLPIVQFIVRGAPHDVVTPRALAQTIYDELHGLHAVTLDDGGADEARIIRISGVQSAPVRLGPDENERHEWSLNFECYVRANVLTNRS